MAITMLLSKVSSGLASPRTIPAIGDVRVDPVLQNYNLLALREACFNLGLVPNPGGSPGCSPVLRALIDQTGLPYGIGKEVANDGQSNGHMGGNAIDVIGTSTSNNAAADMSALCSILASVPELFATVIHHDPAYPDSDLFIWDGAVTTAVPFGGVGSAQVLEAVGRIHISSSITRLSKNLGTTAVSDALAADGTAHAGDKFSDREVYVTTGSATLPLISPAATTDSATPTISFW